MQVIDAREVHGPVFSFYHEGSVSRAVVLKKLEEFDLHEVEVFPYGSPLPIEAGSPAEPVNGGILKVVPRGRVCTWHDDLTDRLEDDERWDPEGDLPVPIEGVFTVFQSTTDHVVDELDIENPRPHDVVARELFDEVYYVKFPTEGPTRLAWGGRHITECVAVIDYDWPMDEDAVIIFVDLRGLGLFMQWVRVPGTIFDPTAYYESLQLVELQGWTLTIGGGEPVDDHRIRVRDGELIELYMTLTADASTSDEEPTDEDSESGPDDEGSDILRSSSPDTDMDPGHGLGGPPAGPPPPQPVRPRSRSPRRSPERTPEGDATMLQLAEHLPTVTYDMSEDKIDLPHCPADIAQAFQVWPPTWMQTEIFEGEYKPETVAAKKELVHWAQVLAKGSGSAGISAELYVDGSYFSKKGTSGYAVAVFIRCAGLLALFGLFGDQILGSSAGLWSDDAPPALYAEQVALATALLWIGQSMHYMRAQEYKILFDCQVAGWGASGQWSGSGGFADKVRALEQYVQGLSANRLSFEHVHSHQGHPWNELVDVVAKRAAGAAAVLAKPPWANCAAFLRLDMTWMAAIARWGPDQVINQEAGKWLVIGDPGMPQCSPLSPETLLPMVGQPSATEKADDNMFYIKCATINVQGLKDKNKFVSDQFSYEAYQVIFMQETKTDGGTWVPGDFLRFATKAEKHWGTAIWLHKTRGFLSFNGKPLIAEEQDVFIRAQTPRLLLLEIQKGGLRCILFSAHVPHEGRQQERVHFLHELQRHLHQAGEADIIVGGIDANGRPPCYHHPVTGSVEYGDSDEAGAQFVEALRASAMWLPATFEAIHSGPNATFCHANGQLHRIDFLAVGGTAWLLQAASWVDSNIDLASSRDDHYVSSLIMTGQTRKGVATRRLWRKR